MVSEKELESAKAAGGGVGSYGFHLPRPLNIEEKKYLLSVERGDMSNVRRILQAANKSVGIYTFQKDIASRGV